MKVIIVIFTTFSVIYAFIFNSYDIFLIMRSSKIKVIISKIIVTTGLNIFIGTILYIMFIIIWLLTPYQFFVNIIATGLLRVVMFIMFYSLIEIMLIIIFKHIYILIIPLLGFLVSTYSIDLGVEVSDLSTFSLLINLGFPDLINVDNSFQFLYGDFFIITVLCLLQFVSVRKYILGDLKI